MAVQLLLLHSISKSGLGKKEVQKSEVLACGHYPWGKFDLASLFGYAHVSSSHREADPWQREGRHCETES